MEPLQNNSRTASNNQGIWVRSNRIKRINDHYIITVTAGHVEATSDALAGPQAGELTGISIATGKWKKKAVASNIIIIQFSPSNGCGNGGTV